MKFSRNFICALSCVSLIGFFTVSSKALAVEMNQEIELAPSVGYGTDSGLLLGTDISYAYKVAPRIQLIAGAFIVGDKEMQRSGVHLGADYNFSEDLPNSFFAGAGVGYTDYHFDDQSDLTWIYGRVGKRFLLSEKWGITYKPFLQIQNGHGSNVILSLEIISFSCLF